MAAGAILASERLREKISQALSVNRSAVYEHQCILHNPNTEYKYTVWNLKGVSFSQPFASDYADAIQVDFAFARVTEQIEFQKNIKDLECTLILTPMDSFNYVEMDGPDANPIIIKAKVFTDASAQVDPEKATNINKFGDSDTPDGQFTPQDPSQAMQEIPMTIHLIEEDVHTLRQCKFDAMFKDQELEPLLHWLAERCGAQKTIIIPPDNKQKYNNLMITDMDNVGGLLPKLQERNGIYSKGLGFYYTKKTFYMYPLFDVAEDTSPAEHVVHIISGPKDYYQGCQCYHNIIEGDIYIATTAEPELTPMGTEGTMNDGNVAVSFNADQVKDQYAAKSPEGQLTRDNSAVTVISKQNTGSDTSTDMQNINYKDITSNIYAATSQLASKDAIVLKTNWPRAVPRLLEPGQTVYFHFDAAQGLYKTRKGRLQAINYAGTMTESMVLKKWLMFHASMSIWLEPDNADASQTQQA